MYIISHQKFDKIGPHAIWMHFVWHLIEPRFVRDLDHANRLMRRSNGIRNNICTWIRYPWISASVSWDILAHLPRIFNRIENKKRGYVWITNGFILLHGLSLSRYRHELHSIYKIGNNHTWTVIYVRTYLLFQHCSFDGNSVEQCSTKHCILKSNASLISFFFNTPIYRVWTLFGINRCQSDWSYTEYIWRWRKKTNVIMITFTIVSVHTPIASKHYTQIWNVRKDNNNNTISNTTQVQCGQPAFTHWYSVRSFRNNLYNNLKPTTVLNCCFSFGFMIR